MKTAIQALKEAASAYAAAREEYEARKKVVEAAIIVAHESGEPITHIAETAKMSRQTIYRIFTRAGVNLNPPAPEIKRLGTSTHTIYEVPCNGEVYRVEFADYTDPDTRPSWHIYGNKTEKVSPTSELGAYLVECAGRIAPPARHNSN